MADSKRYLDKHAPYAGLHVQDYFMNEVWVLLRKQQRQQCGRWMQCKVPISHHNTHTQCLREPQQLGRIQLWWKAGFTWRAHTTLPEADGAVRGAVASHQPPSTHWCRRCKGKPDFLNLRLRSPWLCPYERVVRSSFEATPLAIPPIASCLGSQGGSARPKRDSFQRKLNGKFRSRDARNALPSFNGDWRIWNKRSLGQIQPTYAVGPFGPEDQTKSGLEKNAQFEYSVDTGASAPAALMYSSSPTVPDSTIKPPSL